MGQVVLIFSVSGLYFFGSGRLLRRSLRKTMVLTASVVYRHVFTHNSYGYSSSVRLIADCEHLTTEEQLCANPGGHPSRY